MSGKIIRCDWAASGLLFEYHDNEWGNFTLDDRVHFEHICLEGFQAGLSWEVILRKREAMREMFANFEPESVIKLGRKEVKAIYTDARGIRNRKKIDSVLNNARCFLKMQEEFGPFAEHIFDFIGGKIVSGDYESWRDIPAYTDIAASLSKYLKKRGFTYMGPTTIYAHMQALGFVDDHINSCFKKGLSNR